MSPPSLLHELLVDLFRQCTTLAPDLMQNVLGVPLPRYTEVRVEDANLSQVAPVSYHADLVVLLVNGAPVFAIILEVQLTFDPAKRWIWPAYVVTARARLKCPVALLVVTPDANLARRAAKPIVLGPESMLTPVVLGPDAVPVVSDIAEAQASPELAVLSALSHGNAPEGGAKVVLAALQGTCTLDEERGKLYADMVLASLGDAMKRELEAMMISGKYEYQSDFAKKYFAEGRAEGEAKGKAEGKAEGAANALLRVLAGRGWTVPDEVRARVLGCSDVDQLGRWIDAALRADALEAVFTDPSARH